MPQQAKEGETKKTTHAFSASRAAIGTYNSNAPQIASYLVGDHQLRDSHRSPTKEDVKMERRSLKRALNHLQTSHEWRRRRVENLMAEKRGLLSRIHDDKNESKGYTDAILLDAEKVYSDDFVLMK